MPKQTSENIYRYWGKAKPSEKSGASYHLLAYHCLDVASVGKTILEDQPTFLNQLEQVSSIQTGELLNWIPFLLAIHDIGKFADGFQNLRPDLMMVLQKRSTQATYQHRHDLLGYCFCREFLPDLFIKSSLIHKESEI